MFDLIRQLFAKTREAKIRGYKPGRFSFNVKGGRCEACQGQGTKRIEMHFLPDVYVTCAGVQGHALQPRDAGGPLPRQEHRRRAGHARRGGAGVLRELPQDHASSSRPWTTWGWATSSWARRSTTLSGGEAQRVKLATELGKTATGHTLYVLDEPTTGLHFADIHNLLNVLNRLVDMGNTVVVIEHNLDVIKCADWIIDLGPEGGDAGGHDRRRGHAGGRRRVAEFVHGQFLASRLPRPARPGGWLRTAGADGFRYGRCWKSRRRCGKRRITA